MSGAFKVCLLPSGLAAVVVRIEAPYRVEAFVQLFQ